MSKLTKTANKSLNVLYAFSENDKVYIKKNTSHDTIHNEEWYPVSFQWKSVIN